MNTLMLTHRGTFPIPVHEGSASIWHLAEVLDGLKMRGGYQIDTKILEVARVMPEVNIVKEASRYPRKGLDNMALLIA